MIDCKRDKKQKKLFALFDCIFKLTFARSNSFCLIASQIINDITSTLLYFKNLLNVILLIFFTVFAVAVSGITGVVGVVMCIVCYKAVRKKSEDTESSNGK